MPATPVRTEDKKVILKAIDELGRSVTPADIAAKTGLPILKATAELNEIAEETQGHLEVATTGDIAYKFDRGFQNAYLAKGMQKVLQDIGDTTFKVGFFLLRISFGIMLVVSFILVIVLIIAAMLAMQNRDDRDGGGGGGGGFSLDFFDYLILRDLFWWGSYPTYPGYIDYDRPSTRVQSKSNFLGNCFSFLFGDGNPNLHLDERKWQCIAQLIKQNNGVSTAEQLAPYTGADPKNEDGVLPVLVRFNGTPEVTESGNIIYLFPSLQVTAAQGGSSNLNSALSRASVPAWASGPLPTYMREFPWEFTTVPSDQLTPVWILALVNFFGSWWLLMQSSHILLLFTLKPLIVALVTYGTFFLAVPGVRYLVIQMLNKRIEKRNEMRSNFTIPLQRPAPELQKKLTEAKELRIKEKKLTKDDVVYRSDRDALEQEFDASPGPQGDSALD